MGQRLIITEEDRDSIRRLHKSNIFESLGYEVLGEQSEPVAGSTPQASTQQPAQTQQLTKIQQLQTKLNEKFNSGLTVDGKWGPKTALAVVNALKSTTNQQPAPKEEPIQKLPTAQATPIARTNTNTQLATGTPQVTQQSQRVKDEEGAVTPIQGLRRRLQR
jgi:hypothetical protein